MTCKYKFGDKLPPNALKDRKFNCPACSDALEYEQHGSTDGWMCKNDECNIFMFKFDKHDNLLNLVESFG